MKTYMPWRLALLFFVGLFGCGGGMNSHQNGIPSLPPIPPDVKIIQPAADIPKEVRAFSGEFRGKWYSRIVTLEGREYGLWYVNFSLYVLNIRRAEGGNIRAQVIYAWGGHNQLGKEGGFREHDATVEKIDGRTTLRFEWKNGKKWAFHFENDKLQGDVTQSGFHAVAFYTERVR